MLKNIGLINNNNFFLNLIGNVNREKLEKCVLSINVQFFFFFQKIRENILRNVIEKKMKVNKLFEICIYFIYGIIW